MPKLRLASALLIPPPEATEVDGLRRAFGDLMLGRVDAHVTLVEPINVREESLDEVERIMREAAAEAGPLTFTFGPARSFHPASPVLYLAVDGDLDELAALRSAIRVGPFGREAAWPFVPHVTIATDLSEARLTAGVEALADFSLTTRLTHVHVLQEQRDADEVRRWRPIADAALGGRTISGRGGIELEVTQTTGTGWTLTARHQGAVVGEARGWTADGISRLSWLSVAEDARGLGVGRRLLAGVEEVARQAGVSRVAASSPDSLPGFLRARGWRDEGDAVVRDL